MPAVLYANIAALAEEVEEVMNKYDAFPSADHDDPLSMKDLLATCNRVDELRLPDTRIPQDAIRLLENVENNINSKLAQVRAKLRSVDPSRNRTLPKRSWRHLRWVVIERKHVETDINELRTMVALSLSVLERAALAASFSNPAIPQITIMSPSEGIRKTTGGRFRVWLSTYTPYAFIHAVTAAPNGLEIPHEAYSISLDQFPARSGGFANIYKGNWNGLPIALKQLKPRDIPESAIKVG